MLNRDVTVIVKVTNSCDMRCRYCFIEPAIFSQRMSDQTAQRVVHAFLDSDAFDSVRFVWHGGEPLLRGGVLRTGVRRAAGVRGPGRLQQRHTDQRDAPRRARCWSCCSATT